jgi:hypothetical protein
MFKLKKHQNCSYSTKIPASNKLTAYIIKAFKLHYQKQTVASPSLKSYGWDGY